MATSDSEDFESADEWEDEEKEHSKDNSSAKVHTSKSDVKSNQNNTDVKKVLFPDNSSTVVSEVDYLDNDVAKNLSVSSIDKKESSGSGDLQAKPVIDRKEKSGFGATKAKSVIDKNKNLCSSDTKAKPVIDKKENSGVGDTEAKSNISSNSKVCNETKKQIDETSEENSKLSLVDECKITSVKEAATVVETDGWECEDEEIDELIDDHSKGSVESVLDRLSGSVEREQPSGGNSGGWSSWGSWGVTSILTTATESVSTLTNQVSQGLSTVLETGLGVPNPEELVRQEIEDEKRLLASVNEKNKANEDKEEESASLFGLGRVISGVSSITKLVETASTKVVSGGLDTLETIGKKTMEVLQEGDPGLRKKRAIFSENIVLSQVLREAKDKAEEEDRAIKSTQEARRIHFETLFDDYHGLVHLEALEMLSKQSSIKLQSLLLNVPSSEMAEYQEALLEIKELCQKCEEEEPEGATFEALKSKLTIIGEGLGVPVANEKFVKTWEEVHQYVKDLDNKQADTNETEDQSPVPSAQEMYQKAIDTLARLTAECVEQFHKTAELLLVYDNRNPKEEAKIMLDMASTFSLQVSTAATVFSEHLNTSPESAEYPDTINSHITNIFLEANNSSSYILEAFQLLVPVLQVGISFS